MHMLNTSLGDLARANPAATRVFLRHRLDFCCGGRRTLADACEEAGLDGAMIVQELEDAARAGGGETRWEDRSQTELADFIESHYHASLRRDLPPLVEAARKVERVHAQKPGVPRGLGDVLDQLTQEMLAHMVKEEKILFPMLRRGARGEAVYMPVRVMESEHDAHAEQLAKIRQLTNDLQLPAHACATWTALYNGLEAMEAELMQHIHLENNLLFSRATREG